ncbi:hypothetical protein HYX13_02030 [Candidatus Woesearchaeota archaeon]|nr:hypothetical protein [Candidatus Woesearchaeota archaeon]
MQPLQSYLTKEGWYNDIYTTAERWSTMFPNSEKYRLETLTFCAGITTSTVFLANQYFVAGVLGLIASTLTSLAMCGAAEINHINKGKLEGLTEAEINSIKKEKEKQEQLTEATRLLDQKIDAIIRQEWEQRRFKTKIQ